MLSVHYLTAKSPTVHNRPGILETTKATVFRKLTEEKRENIKEQFSLSLMRIKKNYNVNVHRIPYDAGC